jgi:rare lipoprotein A
MKTFSRHLYIACAILWATAASAQTAKSAAAPAVAPAPAAAPTPAAAPAASTPAAPAPAAAASGDHQLEGVAAYYNNRLNGRKTASGQRFDNAALTAAHNTLPFGTRVKVTNTKNNRSVVVRINDRGPTTAGRIFDLSRAAAGRLGYVRSGLTEVKAEVVAQAPAKRAGKAAK